MNCLSNGRYCAIDPDESGPLQGADVIQEYLRQLCIWKVSPESWYKYARAYRNCTSANVEQNSFKICGVQAQIFLQMQSEEINGCIRRSYTGVMEESENTILEEELQIGLAKIIKWPTIFSNQLEYRGDIESDEGVQEFICNSF